MSDEHRKAFVAESEEGITELNNALLALESDPEDAEAMDQIFRTAHTLKGNGAAMGYDSVSDLAHEMEDLLDEIRSGEIEINPELMDLLFDGVDYLSAMVDDIAEEGETDLDASGVEADLRELIETGEVPGASSDSDSDSTETESTDDADEADESDEADDEADDETDDSDEADESAADIDLPEELADYELDTGHAVFRATVGLGESAMQGVDAIFVLQALDDAYETFVTDPDRETIEDGDFEETFDLYLIDSSQEAIESGLSSLSKVESVSVTPVTAIVDDPMTAAEAAELDITDSATDAGDDEQTDDADSGSSDDAEQSEDDGDSDSDDSGGRSTPNRSKKDGTNIASVRVDVDQLDELYSLVEQLVTSRIKLRREMESAGMDSDNLDELDKITANLQNTAMDMRLIPLSKVVDTFPRLVRDVARETGKQVNFNVSGSDIELDRTILTEIRDPLIHILRNSVDHGIEPPEEREEKGKAPTGSVSLTATRERDHVTIEVADDGAGLDKEVLKEKAIEKGVKTQNELELMDDQEIYELIFHPGFSTAEEVTDVSGRGVGMDVVRNTVKQLDGTVTVDSELGEGTVVRLRLPVTVAIVKVMFVEVGGTEYGIPVKNIAEVTRAKKISETNNKEIIKHDDDIYPVLRLSDVLDEPSAVNGDGMLLRIRDEKRKVALHCDQVIDQEEVVVKPLEGVLSGIPGLSGTAVLGDGDVVAVLDVVTL
ncbi:chemotaxis protein CheA [Halohasta litorea]|uniref:Chemotaxis protein CheA n=1 Tax=Halohasta litorea TaxID=869891 RepID=A0ABD6D3F3_9EURY|nr:chemotaxis protein CheA [Halohasta litorea]